MGGSSWSSDAADRLYRDSHRVSAPVASVFRSHSVDAVKHAGIDPKSIKMRESRDSDAHPNSIAIEVLLDVTGSMGVVPEAMARKELPGLMRLLIDHSYIEDPQILFGAIGDGFSDSAPLQVGQFESGIEMDEWLTKIWIEGNGGGTMEESYELALYWSTHHVSMDCLEKRGKKGYIFLVGDEKPYDVLTRGVVERWIGDKLQADLKIEEVIAQASEKFEIFYIHAPSGSYPGYQKKIQGRWKELLGQRCLILDDIKNVCPLIGSTIGLCEGRGLDSITADLKKAGVSNASDVTDALVPYASSRGSSIARKGTITGDLAKPADVGSTKRL